MKDIKRVLEAFICETVSITNRQFSLLQAFDMTEVVYILQPMQKKTTMPKE